MERALREFGSIDHVCGAFVCDNAGDVLASSSPPVLASVAMVQIGRAGAQVFAAMETALRPVDHVEFTFDSWRLFVRDLGEALLVLVAEPAVDTAILRMTMDVVIAGWRSDARVQKRLHRAAASARVTLVSEASVGPTAWQSWGLIRTRS